VNANANANAVGAEHGRGQRAAGSGTRGRILDAARTEFAERGYLAASVRAISRRASVDPALVRHYFGAKADLFAAANDIPAQPERLITAVLAVPQEQRGEQLVRSFSMVWDNPPGRQRLRALIASLTARPAELACFREFVVKEIVGRVVGAAGGRDQELRASLVVSQMFGLALVRIMFETEPLASVDIEAVVRWVGPTVQRYLDPPED
jgi:AcrR family transcriptional regulator